MPERTFDAVAVRELRAELQRCIADCVEKFASETGMGPSEIDIDIQDVTHFGNGRKKYVVANVYVRFDP